MNEVMMVPVDEFQRLSGYFQGQITESAVLNKAGRLAAEQNLILRDKNIPASMAVRITKPMALQQGRLVKRIRTGTAAPTQFEGVEEPEGPVEAPLKRLLKQVIRGQRPEVIEIPETPEVKKERKTPTTSVKKKPPVKKPPKALSEKRRTLPPTPGRKILPTSISEAAKSALRDIGFVESPKARPQEARARPKRKKTEVEQLQEGWELWDYPVRRTIRYAGDREEEEEES